MNRKKYRTIVTLVALSMAGASAAWAQISAPMSDQLPAATGALTQSRMPETQKVEGPIRSVDPAKHTITLEDGTALTIPATVKVAPSTLKKGAKVSATYKEQSGQRVVTSLRTERQKKS